MTTLHVPNSQQCVPVRVESFFQMYTLRAGNAISWRSRKPMVLRLLACSGQAWITLARKPRGAESEAEDLFLVAGQQLQVAPGEHLVMEAAAAQAVRYQWAGADELSCKR
ncbi:hypothetical protein SDC9_89251 [bioreactor metagenome]|uniref:DUF2917 domain-containing protein n=1 Tax=bioreactor metagenome TaxID=1076179 RepID=A0A644ZNV2_9ZZZZ